MWLAALAAVTLEIDARLDPAAQIVEGHVTADVQNPTREPLDRLYFWLYPNRFARPPAALDDVNRYWIYPRGFDAGSMGISGVAAAILDHEKAGPQTLAMIALAHPLAPGGRTTVGIAFRTRIPSRYGPFGCAAGVCTLAAGWYPMVAFLDERGWDLAASPARADVEVRVQSPWATLLGGRVATEARLPGARQVPLVAFKSLYQGTRTCAAVHVTYASRFRPVPPSNAQFPYGLENFYEIGLDAICEALAMLHELGLDPPAGTELSIAEVPLRHELASAQGSQVLLSDRIWRLFPLERFRKFHTLQAVRAVYAALLEQRMASIEEARDLAWTPDAVAAYWVDLFTVRQYRRREFARDVLKYFSFVPQVDDLIYAPKVAFMSAYFGSVEERDLTRDDLRRFNNDVPKGKRVYEKLRDLLGWRVMAVMRGVILGERPFRQAAERAAGSDLAWFFAQWLGRYPPGDVRIEAVESDVSAHGFVHHVRVIKRGAAREPVVLWARDDAGREMRSVWDGQGQEHVYEFESGAPLDVVHVDPNERLVEQWQHQGDPRFDNRTPPRWKLLYANVGGLFNVTEVQLSFAANFIVRRVYDLKNSFSFGFFRTPATDVGGTVGYARGFGVPADSNRLTAGTGASVTVGRLNETFAEAVGEGAHPGTQVSVAAGPAYDDRVWHIDPERGTAAGASGWATSTMLDDGPALWTYGLGAGVTRLLRIASGHGLAANFAAGATFGELELATQLVSPGLPGYEADELFGRGVAVARLEYRHVFVQGLDWNFVHLGHGRGIGGAVLLDAATLSDCEDLGSGWFTRDSTFVDAGYSLRGYFDQLGVAQAVLRIDVAFPLTRQHRLCLGYDNQPDRRAPFSLSVVFAPSF